MVVNRDMCFYCFDVLSSTLNNEDPPKTPKFTNDAYPLFVTWKTEKYQILRGCVGTFNPVKLHKGLREFAISSAKDTRFEPITADEMCTLHVAVSLLRYFEPASDYTDWEIGVHGLWIEFYNEKGKKRTATFLPEVAYEEGWTKSETIDSLLRKGGFRGVVTPDFLNTIKVTRYQSERMSVSYEEYIKHMETTAFMDEWNEAKSSRYNLRSTSNAAIQNEAGSSGTNNQSGNVRNTNGRHGRGGKCISTRIFISKTRNQNRP